MPDLTFGTTAGSASASRGDTAVLGLEDDDTTAKTGENRQARRPLAIGAQRVSGVQEDNIRSRIDKFGVFR